MALEVDRDARESDPDALQVYRDAREPYREGARVYIEADRDAAWVRRQALETGR